MGKEKTKKKNNMSTTKETKPKPKYGTRKSKPARMVRD